MQQQLWRLGTMGALMVLMGWFASDAQAEPRVLVFSVDQEDGDVLPTLNDAFEDEYFTFDRPFFANRRFPRTITPLLGPYPENEISGDGRRVHNLYVDALEQQITPDLVIRVADLPTPFDGSLGTTPLYVEEPVPPAPPSVYREPSTAAPAAEPSSQPASPVPALW